MRAIRICDHKKAVASWRKSFKQTWKQCQSQEISPQSLYRYQTDPVKWTCGCEAFLLSRFLLCKHIIHCSDESGDLMKFFGRILRQQTCPFWTDDQLVLRPEFRVSENNITIISVDESSLNLVLDSDSEESEEQFEENLLTSLEEEAPASYNCRDFQSTMRRAMEISDEQEARGNTRFVEIFIESNVSNQTPMEKIQQLKNRHTMPLTWTRRRHPATMYYN